MTTDRQVIHLFIKATGEHYYFGSIAAIYEHFDSSQLGVAAQTLYNKMKGTELENEMIILRKGRLVIKKNKKTSTSKSSEIINNQKSSHAGAAKAYKT